MCRQRERGALARHVAKGAQRKEYVQMQQKNMRISATNFLSGRPKRRRTLAREDDTRLTMIEVIGA
jgi:hypothetical protein